MLKRLRLSWVTLAIVTAACTISETPAPPLTGPSEFAISLNVAADPDLITRDGVTRSTITVTAHDAHGAPIRRSDWLRLDMFVGNSAVEGFGSLSERLLDTDSEGRATAFYTSPLPPAVPTSVVERVRIVVTPLGTNAQAAMSRSAEIRLVSKVTVAPDAPFPKFRYDPPSGITTGTTVRFDASESYAMPGSRIVNYAWDWRDGGTSRNSVTEEHDWEFAGSYDVTLTVTDDFGRQASHTERITVG